MTPEDTRNAVKKQLMAPLMAPPERSMTPAEKDAAKMIARAIREAVLEEREACARIAESFAEGIDNDQSGDEIAEQIRARTA